MPSLSFVLSPFLVSQRQFSTLLGNKDLFCSVPFIKDRDPRAGADRGGPAGSLERRSAHGRRAPEVPEGVRAASPAQVRPDAEALSHRPGFSSSERCDIRKVCREKKTMFCRSFCMLGKRGRLRGRSQHLAGVVANLGKVLVPLCDVIEGIRSLKKCDQVSRSNQEVKEGLFTCSGR